MPQATPQVLENLFAAWIPRCAARKGQCAAGSAGFAGRFLMVFKAFGGEQLVAVLTFLKLWLWKAIVKLCRISEIFVRGFQ